MPLAYRTAPRLFRLVLLTVLMLQLGLPWGGYIFWSTGRQGPDYTGFTGWDLLEFVVRHPFSFLGAPVAALLLTLGVGGCLWRLARPQPRALLTSVLWLATVLLLGLWIAVAVVFLAQTPGAAFPVMFQVMDLRLNFWLLPVILGIGCSVEHEAIRFRGLDRGWLDSR